MSNLFGLKLVLLTFLIMSLSAAFAATHAEAQDVVVFNNGDSLTGKLTSATASGITFSNDGTKLVAPEWKNIREVNVAAARPLCVIFETAGLVSSFVLQQGTIRVQPGGDLRFSSATGDHRFLAHDLRSVTPQAAAGAPHYPTSIFQGWGGQLQAQGSLTTSTQRQYQVGLTAAPARETGSSQAFAYQITNIKISANYGESRKPNASPVITHVYEGALQEDIYLTNNQDSCGNRRWGGARFFVGPDFYHNFSLGLYLSQFYSAGFGWDRQSGKDRMGRQKYGFTAGLGYLGEHLYAPGISQKLIAAKVSEFYMIKLAHVTGKPIYLTETGSVIPAFNNSHAFQARGLAKLTIPVASQFSIGVQEIDDYLRNAPPKSKQNYSSLQMTFTYTFGAATPAK